MKDIKYLLFDAANTLIHKPGLWPAIQAVLSDHGYTVPDDKLKLHHKLLSEVINFPDRTSKEFYHYFNAELLLSFAITPNENILSDLFDRCSYLPWESFPDTEWLQHCKIPMGVLSNFNNNLPGLLVKIFGNIFTNIIVSENAGARKPDLDFYKHALAATGLPANQILYVGDSMKLDKLPAGKLGFQVLLIDRQNLMGNSKQTIQNLADIQLHLN